MIAIRRLILTLVLLLAAAPAVAADNTHTSGAAQRARALEALFARASESRPIARLSFRPDEISVTAQGDSGEDFVEWSVQRIDLKLFTMDNVSGPRAAPEFSIVDDIGGAFFRLADIDVKAFDAVVAAAIAYARLADIPSVDYVEIARGVSILPEPAYGEIRWTVSLRTARESATVYTDAAGGVIGGDLSDTIRAKNLDLYQSDDWPMAEAQALLASVLGTSLVHELRIYDSYIFVTADHPTDSSLQRDYSWNLEGVTRGLVDTPNLVTLGLGGMATFALSELDLTKLPAIKAAAIEAFASPDAAITAIDADKPTDRASGDLRVLWEVEFRQGNGEEGEVLLDTDGNVVEVHLPDSRMPAVGPWLAPATLVDTLQRIEKAFGPDTRIFSISINDEQGSIELEDPLAPGEVAQFLIDEREVQRFGTGSFFADLADEHVFTMQDLAPLTEAKLAELSERTLQRINMPDAEIYRYTISRQALIMDPSDNRLMIEVRAGKDSGNEGGWLTFLLDGTQTDELLP